jgi:hypothetical protein
MFAAARRAFEDADVTGLDYIETDTRLPLSENGFTGRIVAPNGALRKKGQFIFRKPRKNGDFGQHGGGARFYFWHDGYCNGPVPRVSFVISRWGRHAEVRKLLYLAAQDCCHLLLPLPSALVENWQEG